LTWIAVKPVAGRPESLAAINTAMKRIAGRIRHNLKGVHVNEVVNARESIVTKLTVQTAGAQIKIEVTPVLRGCVYEPEMSQFQLAGGGVHCLCQPLARDAG